MIAGQDGPALQAENDALRHEVATLREQVAQVQAQLAAAQARIAELENQPVDPSALVKAPTPKRARPPRRKRKPEHHHARRREPPTRIEQHALERCPACGQRLHGGTLARRRQVIELPAPQPVEGIEHQVIKRWCAWCNRWQAPPLDLRGQVLGQSRLGVRLASVIAYLRHTLRLPIRRMQAYLQTLHHLRISSGAIVELLHHVRRATQPAVDRLKAQARASPILHADETGWREAGQNGHVWAFSTLGEEAVRYYEYDPSRAGAVAKRILDGKFQGHRVSDFYGGYNLYAGKHQRCWVHFLRDLHALREAQPRTRRSWPGWQLCASSMRWRRCSFAGRIRRARRRARHSMSPWWNRCTCWGCSMPACTAIPATRWPSASCGTRTSCCSLCWWPA